MKKIRIGILGPANIALNKMIPAIIKSDKYEYVGIAVANEQERLVIPSGISDIDHIKDSIKKAVEYNKKYNGKTYLSYEDMLKSNEIDVVYIALPPILHYYWGKRALLNNINVIMEKPFTTSLRDTKEIVSIAKEKNLALIENFAFVFHPQIIKIQEILKSEQFGDLKLVRSNFCFPFKGENDFRYKKELGGGALFDCGCYTVKAAQLFLGADMKIIGSKLVNSKIYSVDMQGAIIAVNDKGVIAQLSFGMDQQYSCELELFGSKGYVKSSRIFTAPENFAVKLIIKNNNEETYCSINPENQFVEILNKYSGIMYNNYDKLNLYNEIIKQNEYIEQCLIWSNR